MSRPGPLSRRGRLSADERGRIPFALLGALLLAASVGIVATVEQTPTGDTDRTGSEAVAELTTVESTAFQSGIKTGAAAAAADPVTEPANTSYGAVLDEDDPFRSQVELLAYAAVADRLNATKVTRDGVTATTAVPPVTNATTAADAIDRTTVEPAGPGAVRAEIDGATRVVRSGDRLIEREPITLDARVATPALTLHDRTSEYEAALDSGPTSGIGPAFSGRMNGIAWGRGLLQYAGGPIDQVLAPRHVELGFNDAAIAQQRQLFGTADERLTRGLVRRAGQLTDEAVGKHNNTVDIRPPNAPAGPALQDDFRPDWFERSRDAAPTPVPIGPHATVALDQLFLGEDGDSLTDVIDDVYSADLHGTAETAVVRSETLDSPAEPEANWTLVAVDESRTVTNVSATGPQGQQASLPPGWRETASFARTVRAEQTTIRTYERKDGEEIKTRERTARTHEVAGTIGIRVGHSSHAPERSHAGFDPTGVFAEIDDRAVDSYFDAVGDPDALATAVVDGESLPEHTVAVTAPPELESAIRSELHTLADDLAEESVTVDRGRVATEENPTEQLRAEIDATSDDYVQPPASYTDPEQKAMVAARSAYLDRLLDRLDDSADVVDGMQSAVDVAARIDESVGDAPIDDIIVASADAVRPTPSSIDAAEPAPGLSLSVESDPAYVTTNRVDAEHLQTVNRSHSPAAIRTINAVSLPTRSIAEHIAEVTGGLLFDEADDLPLSTAAQTLAAVEAVPKSDAPDSLVDQRNTLRTEVQTGLTSVQEDIADGLEPVTTLDAAQRSTVVDEGFERWDDLDKQVAAAENGSVVSDIADAVVDHPASSPTMTDRERVELRLTAAVDSALDTESVGVPEGPVTDALDAARGETEAVVADVTERGIDSGQNRLNDHLRSGSGRVPLGVPIAPPVAWVATVNGWTAQVRGEYASFAVETNHGSPGGAPITYQRSGQQVEYDLTGDGSQERLGTAERVSFSTWTTAIVAVPPGRSGVGNADGHTVLRTPAWPDPGVETADETTSDNNR